MQVWIARIVIWTFGGAWVVSQVPAPDEMKTISAGEDALRTVETCRAGLRSVVAFIDERDDLFPPTRVEKQVLPRDDRRAVVDLWSRALDYLVALDALMSEYKGFPAERDNAARQDGYRICNAAFVTSYRFALEFCDRAVRNPALDVVLNDPVARLGLPRNTYAKMRFRFLNPAAAGQFGALRMLRPVFDHAGRLEQLEWFRDDEAFIWKMGHGRGPVLSLKSAHQAIRGAGFSAWLPVQTRVAEWMGDTRVSKERRSLITPEQIHEMAAALRPGDLIFERREWVLSNLGIPGFWCHVALYVGTPDERRAYFDDGALTTWLQGRSPVAGDLEEVLRHAAPDAYAAQLAGDPSGESLRLIEAQADGVVFTSLEHSAAADSVGVLRPSCDKADVAEAIRRAFVFHGRPYDFNFDFLTDAALVCSEVVYKAYEGVLNFPVGAVMGRPVVSPNDMVSWYAEEGNGALGFVWFLDGYERADAAFVSSEDAFRESWKRPKWHAVVHNGAPQ